MHAIRSQARQVAWKYSDGGVRNYNPFARTSKGGRQRAPDEENDMQHTMTLDQVALSHESERAERNNTEYSPPRHANTAPPTSAINEHPPPNVLTGTGEKDSSDLSNGDKTDMSGDSRVKPEREIPDRSMSHQDTQTDNQPRKRKFFHFGKSKDEDEGQADNQLNRTESGKAKKPKRKITAWSMVKATVFGSWVNVLLIFVPIGIAINYSHVSGVATFVCNFVAIVPLAAMLSYATEELALYVGETLGGLLNATFGNATELIVGVIALAKGNILIVQTSLIGSMLSNLLLVLGMCFFFGGLNRVKQHFNITVAQTASSLLALSIGSLIIPTAFVRFGTSNNAATTNRGVAPISRGTSIILLMVYACYLFFQLKTHTSMYNEPSEKVDKRATSKKQKGDTILGIARMGAGSAAASGGQVNQSNLVQEPDDEDAGPALTVVGALVTLSVSTVLIAFCSEFMVGGIGAISGSVSEEFTGLILLPIVGNAAEHATAVTVATKDKMDLAIGVAVGSSMQIALLVLPLMVVISWCGLGQPADMTLSFDGFQVTVLFIAVLLVNYLIQDGESHWLEGVLLQATYIIIALTAWYYPPNGEVAG